MSSPASRVLRGAPTPCRPSGRTSLPSLGRTAHGLAVRSQARGARLPGSWAWSPGCPTGILRGDDRASQVPGHPPCTHAPLSDPGGISVPGQSRHFDAAFRCCDDVGFHAYQLSGLYHAACALPVYASQRRLPERHATLGSGWWPAFAGRDWLPAGTLRGFQSSLLVHLIPPLQALPGATQPLPSMAADLSRCSLAFSSATYSANLLVCKRTLAVSASQCCY